MNNTIDDNILKGLFEQADDMLEKQPQQQHSALGQNNTQIGDGKTTQLIEGDNNCQIADISKMSPEAMISLFQNK